MSGSIMSGGGVDASIPLQAGKGQAQVNPLESVGNFARTLGAINQTKIQGQTIQSNNMSLAQQMKQLAYSHLAAGLANGTIKTLADATHVMGNLEGFHGISVQPVLQDMASQVGMSRDPLGTLKDLVAANSQPPESAVGAVAPKQTTLDQGLFNQPYLTGAPGTSHQGERVPAGQPAALGAPPGLQGQQVEYLDANGVKQQTTYTHYNELLNNRAVLGPPTFLPSGAPTTLPPVGPAPAPPGSATSGATPAGYTGRFPVPAAPAPVTSIAGPAPGTEKAGEGSAGQYIQDRAAAGSFATRVLPLKQSIDLLSDTDTGPGSETANHFRSVLISAANQGLLPKSITPDAIGQAKFDELKKYFAQYITGMPFAGGSDARMAEAVSGSPNTNMSTLANKDVAKVLVGVERYRAAQTLAFDQAVQQGKYGAAAQANPNAAAGQYANFASHFNQQTDPRAFAHDLMTPAARGKMIAKMTADERAKYQASLRTAYGLPGLMQ